MVAAIGLKCLVLRIQSIRRLPEARPGLIRWLLVSMVFIAATVEEGQPISPTQKDT